MRNRETPVEMRCSAVACDAYNAAFKCMKSSRKGWFSTVFLGFYAKITDFARFLPIFGSWTLENPRQMGGFSIGKPA